MIVPPDVWEQINPTTPTVRGGGLLCPMCICRRLIVLPGVTTVQAFPDTLGVAADLLAQNNPKLVCDDVEGLIREIRKLDANNLPALKGAYAGMCRTEEVATLVRKTVYSYDGAIADLMEFARDTGCTCKIHPVDGSPSGCLSCALLNTFRGLKDGN